VKAIDFLRNLSTGGVQLLGSVVEVSIAGCRPCLKYCALRDKLMLWYSVAQGHLTSEPGFEIQFSGAVKAAADYLTLDPDGVTARGAFVGEIVPDDGDVPFLLRIGGINQLSPQAAAIFTFPTAEGRAVPYGYSYSSRLSFR